MNFWLIFIILVNALAAGCEATTALKSKDLAGSRNIWTYPNILNSMGPLKQLVEFRGGSCFYDRILVFENCEDFHRAFSKDYEENVWNVEPHTDGDNAVQTLSSVSKTYPFTEETVSILEGDLFPKNKTQ